MLVLAACTTDEGGLRSSRPGRAERAGPSDTELTDTSTPSPEDSSPPSPEDSASPSPEDTAPVDEAADPTCGDATCDSDENCWNCAGDCGACDCPAEAEVVIYTQSAWNTLADAFLADPSPCADYWISLPAVSGNKTTPRSSGEPEAMRARGPRFHAMAEFHWATWEDEAGSWYDKGVAFRANMDAAGYDVAAGDSWAINELPSTVRSDDDVRQAAMDAMRGLYEGGTTRAKGAVFIVGMGQDTTNFSVYKPYLKDWLQDADFWVEADKYARFWGQEVYGDPGNVCVGSATVAERSGYTNDYVEHLAQLAEVGPDSANTAQSYLGRAYVPLMNAVWGSSGSGYGDTDISLENMQHFVSTQVYAARAWSNTHAYPDGRVGFAWARSDDVAEADLETIAARLASAIHYAYDEGGGSAAHACSPSGAYTWCACDIASSAFSDGWQTFESW